MKHSEIYKNFKITYKHNKQYCYISSYVDNEWDTDVSYISNPNLLVDIEILKTKNQDLILQEIEKIKAKLVEDAFIELQEKTKAYIDKIYNTMSKDYKELADNIYNYSVHTDYEGSRISPKILEILVNNYIKNKK
jgi:hypothetical protein